MIVHLKEFVSVKDYAKRHRLTPRTTRDHIKRNKIGYTKICCTRLLIDNRQVKMNSNDEPVPGIELSKLLCVPDFAKARNYSPDTIYQNIISGKINAVSAGNKVFISPEDETVIAFQQNVKPKKRKRG